ncbi:hypothetical protein C499_08392 [Halogeometricum borinquense DSM 11551]|uniref:Uncharacterized protein n=2 Tax=Halogeometricum borinquense TaxID=60847 RepID=E4NQZ0_HALBP|nr:hypothetical protein [Halogeometricum borinquense]ADQ65616.1 hypothetical protein Hbor_00030 [Halogeometricum borinquense DSM 11551]ELY27848.1 hypothetical protein C499_08392 [Halogeometricum borinquense DSM 11551]RYJ14966.1 hypothetical protein ELS19_14070 [Halogeometricum borinquense]
MSSEETGVLDTFLKGALNLETLVVLLACCGALGYLTYESLLSTTTAFLAAVGGGAAGIVATVVLLVLGRRFWF